MKNNKILYIDDEQVNLVSFKFIYKKDFDIVITQSPKEALEILSQEKFAIVISDSKMPEMGGVELLEKVAKLYPDTLRILLTGYSDIDTIVSAINKASIFKYINKPFDNSELRNILNEGVELYNKKINSFQIQEENFVKILDNLEIIICQIGEDESIQCSNKFFYNKFEIPSVKNLFNEGLSQNLYKKYSFKNKNSSQSTEFFLTWDRCIVFNSQQTHNIILGFKLKEQEEINEGKN
jgi:response regulator RpfG family c-di-GMP phosphodiesterase